CHLEAVLGQPGGAVRVGVRLPEHGTRRLRAGEVRTFAAPLTGSVVAPAHDVAVDPGAAGEGVSGRDAEEATGGRCRLARVVLPPTRRGAIASHRAAEPTAEIELGVRPGRRAGLAGRVVAPADDVAVDPQRAAGERREVRVVLAGDLQVRAR